MNKRVLIEVFLREHHMGEERAVHSKDLEALFFMSGRALRRCIHQLRSEEIPICSSKNGYYYAKSQAEIKRSAASLGQFSDSVSSTRMNLLSSRAPKAIEKCVMIILPID